MRAPQQGLDQRCPAPAELNVVPLPMHGQIVRHDRLGGFAGTRKSCCTRPRASWFTGTPDGDAVVSIDRPSTVFASLGVRAIDEVGGLLDQKITAVLRGIGVDTGDALGRYTDLRTN